MLQKSVKIGLISNWNTVVLENFSFLQVNDLEKPESCIIYIIKMSYKLEKVLGLQKNNACFGSA